jgi:hypothetical protein
MQNSIEQVSKLVLIGYVGQTSEKTNAVLFCRIATTGTLMIWRRFNQGLVASKYDTLGVIVPQDGTKLRHGWRGA